MSTLRRISTRAWFAAAIIVVGLAAAPSIRAAADQASDDEAACRALTKIANLTILSAEIVPAKGETPAYCYTIGFIQPGIRWHMQLPLPSKWNGRLLNIGNGGKAGNLVFADHRLAEGYAVANSNTGHDNGSEPYGSFGFNNKQAVIDFGYRAVHLTANASKTLTKAYYQKPQQYAYFEGCSTGGRQGMMEAQRFPYDFDGIVVGAPVIDYQKINMAHVWHLQKVMKENMVGSLAYDSDGDRSFKSIKKLEVLQKAVLDKCDANDGIIDGVVGDPQKCAFNPETDLAKFMCPGDRNIDGCFTKTQVQTIKALYTGPVDSKGNLVLKGLALGSEFAWTRGVIPFAGNDFFPSYMGYEVDHVNYLFYENSPGVAPGDIKNPSAPLHKKGVFPEVSLWEFNIDDVTAGKGAAMSKITDAMDPDLTRFLKTNDGKLIMYQGWGDTDAYPNVALDYYKDMVATTFKGDYKAAHEKARLYMVPGMGHCGGGPGVNDWDKLPPLVQWVESGKPPEIVAVHRSERRGDTAPAPVINERPLCPYPQQAVYTGPAGGQNDRANWVAKNFTCKAP